MQAREPRRRRSTGRSGTLTPADTYAYANAIDYDFATHIRQLPENNPYFEVSKPGLKGEAAAQDQRSWPMAEILYHELRHRLILIDRDISALDPRTDFSGAFKKYVVARNYLQETSNRFASTLGGVPARVADVKNLYDHLDAELLHARGQHPR